VLGRFYLLAPTDRAWDSRGQIAHSDYRGYAHPTTPVDLRWFGGSLGVRLLTVAPWLGGLIGVRVLARPDADSR